MKALRWLFLNTCFAVLVYLGMYEDYAVARYLVIALVIVLGLLSLVLLVTRSAFIKRASACDLPVPPPVDKLYDIGITSALVYAGFVFTGLAYLLANFVLHSVLADLLEYRKNNRTDASMKMYLFYCGNDNRLFSAGENPQDAFGKLNRGQRRLWAEQGEFSVEVPSVSEGRKLVYQALLAMHENQRAPSSKPDSQGDSHA